MSEIKLEVGKTYRSREGEEVEIVKRANRGEYPFLGSNGEWYTESGKFDVDVAEPDLDLIEEVPSETTRYTLTVPEGTKEINVSKEDNRLIVEMVSKKGPKPGDVPECESRLKINQQLRPSAGAQTT